jgi:hypothetical protein
MRVLASNAQAWLHTAHRVREVISVGFADGRVFTGAVVQITERGFAVKSQETGLKTWFQFAEVESAQTQMVFA